MLKQRKKLYGSITVLTSKRILSFKCFNQLLLVLQAKDKQGFRSKYKELLGVMSTLATFKPSRSYLLQALDKYLVGGLYNVIQYLFIYLLFEGNWLFSPMD